MCRQSMKSIQVLHKILDSSPRKIKANTATNPGVNASKGKALLICKFFNAVITHKNAATPIRDFINKTERLEEFIAL